MRTFLVFLFSLPFVAVGTVMGYLTLEMIISSYTMSSWPEVPVIIEQSELIETPGSKSITYSIKSKYRYDLDGQSYVGDRVTLSSSADNVGTFHQEKAQILEDYRTENKLFLAKINPANPKETILFPEIRAALLIFYLIFTVAFGGVGYAILVYAIFSSKSESNNAKLAKMHPNEPWMHRNDWKSKKIDYSSRTTFLVVLVIAIFVNVVSLPIIIVLPKMILEQAQYSAFFLLIFILIGLGLLYWAYSAYQDWRKFGNSTLNLSTTPIRPGRIFEGYIEVTKSLQQATNKIDVSLIGKSYLTTGSGKRRTTSVTQFFSENKEFPVMMGMNTAQVRFKFDLPATLHTSSVDNANPRISWSIVAKAKIPGVDYYSIFEIPVFN